MRANTPKDPELEERITMEIVVDCNDEFERYSGWWNYLDAELNFPFQANSNVESVQTVLRKDETVEVIQLLDSEGDDPEPIRVLVKWQDRTFAAPLAELDPRGADDSTRQAVADWHYWVACRYSF